MENIIGEQTRYILVQTNTEVEGSEQVLFYNEYNMTLTPTDVNQATKFEGLEKVQSIANLQNQMAIIFGKPFTYSIVKESITRTVVE